MGDPLDNIGNEEKKSLNQDAKQHKVYLVGLSMGANVCLQCALHENANKLLRGIAVCSGHGGAYLLVKGPDFGRFGESIMSGNALHYGYCDAQRIYIESAHSKTYRARRWNRWKLRTFYSWRLSAHPYFCCNFSNKKLSQNIRQRTNDKKMKGFNQRNKEQSDSEPVVNRGISQWFENKLSLNIRADKHRIVEGIERQTDVAEEGFNVANYIDNISIPTLICYGSEDTIIHSQTADLLQKKIGDNAWKEEFESAGHSFWFEDAKHFVDKIQEWMQTEEDFDVANE